MCAGEPTISRSSRPFSSVTHTHTHMHTHTHTHTHCHAPLPPPLPPSPAKAAAISSEKSGELWDERGHLGTLAARVRTYCIYCALYALGSSRRSGALPPVPTVNVGGQNGKEMFTNLNSLKISSSAGFVNRFDSFLGLTGNRFDSFLGLTGDEKSSWR